MAYSQMRDKRLTKYYKLLFLIIFECRKFWLRYIVIIKRCFIHYLVFTWVLDGADHEKCS